MLDSYRTDPHLMSFIILLWHFEVREAPHEFNNLQHTSFCGSAVILSVNPNCWERL